MKTFQQFLEEAYLILEKKGKFRGTRTPEEIVQLRKKRNEQKTQRIVPSRNRQQIANKYREKSMHHYNLSKTPEGKPDFNSPNYKKSTEYTHRAMGMELPDYQVLDTNKFRGSTKDHLRKLSQARRAHERRKGLNPDTVKPSEHPDTHPSKSSEFDKIVHRRRMRRNKAERKSEVSSMVDKQDREFRRRELEKTIGKIPGQLRRTK